MWPKWLYVHPRFNSLLISSGIMNASLVSKVFWEALALCKRCKLFELVSVWKKTSTDSHTHTSALPFHISDRVLFAQLPKPSLSIFTGAYNSILFLSIPPMGFSQWTVAYFKAIICTGKPNMLTLRTTRVPLVFFPRHVTTLSCTTDATKAD